LKKLSRKLSPVSTTTVAAALHRARQPSKDGRPKRRQSLDDISPRPARAELLRAKRLFTERLQISPTSVDTLMRALRSHLDFTLYALSAAADVK
jgi:hypothetical protein